MIQLELKAKHFYLIADILFTESAKYLKLQSFLSQGANIGINTTVSQPVIDNIRTACQGLQDDDLVTVSVDTTSFVGVFKILAQKAEGSYNNINTEMMDLLTPQIISGVGNNDSEWINLESQITTIRTSNLQVITESIQSGKNKLYP
jgi:hypothetical protein